VKGIGTKRGFEVTSCESVASAFADSSVMFS
jgi:hypothetical protein